MTRGSGPIAQGAGEALRSHGQPLDDVYYRLHTGMLEATGEDHMADRFEGSVIEMGCSRGRHVVDRLG